jgi:hypothetical protein
MSATAVHTQQNDQQLDEGPVDDPQRLRVISYGGGVQSTALLALAAAHTIPFRRFLFANVGHDSEHPATLDYLHRWAVPFAAAHHLELIELRRVRRDGRLETLYGRLTDPDTRFIPIPARGASGAPGHRLCTADFKIRVIAAWLKAQGASKKRPATVGLGISLDEIQRITNRKVEAYERLVYPLLDHDPPLRRTDCTRLIRDAGLPVPPKSACWFCPMRTQQSWLAMRVDEPALFQRVVELEQLLNQRRTALGLRPVWFSHRTKPLDQAVPDGVQPLPLAAPLAGPDNGSDTGCDNGWCMT